MTLIAIAIRDFIPIGFDALKSVVFGLAIDDDYFYGTVVLINDAIECSSDSIRHIPYRDNNGNQRIAIARGIGVAYG